MAAYESDVFELRHIFPAGGRRGISVAQAICGTLSARSGNVDNPDRKLESLEKVELQKVADVSVPAARFIQWKALLPRG